MVYWHFENEQTRDPLAWCNFQSSALAARVGRLLLPYPPRLLACLALALNLRQTPLCCILALITGDYARAKNLLRGDYSGLISRGKPFLSYQLVANTNAHTLTKPITDDAYSLVATGVIG